uniref:Reverse transcriptase zinc-binding domain-containing protein n=1 Tax=Aegilops tauschii subsp. strangulata TaxID=200361 RepID=A0A453SYU7_AEGTS
MVGRRIKLGAGDLTRVWKDPINGLPPLNLIFPQLFEICTDHDCTGKRFGSVVMSTFFRRRPCPGLKEQWDKMREQVAGLNISTDRDTVYWGLSKNARYFTKSMYKWLEKPLSGCNYKWIWEAKLPLK